MGLLLSACGPSVAPSTPIPTLAPRQATATPAAPAATPTAEEATPEPPQPDVAAGADLEAALLVYEAQCQACHGAQGRNAAVGPDLAANPEVDALSDAEITDIVVNGVPGTAMQAFGDRLSSEEIDSLVALIRSWQAGEEAAAEPPAVAADLDTARADYAAMCQGCHGQDGLNGAVGPALAGNPAVAALSDEELSDILHNGVPGTAMVAFSGRLSDERIDALIALIREWNK